jgi:predicted  nucleic acid-binding Zn-ribbon protein
MNHVGKSTLIKQIFETLGATPMGKLEGWDPATIAVLTASVDGEDFLFLRQLTNRALFNSAGELIAYAGRLSDWVKFFGEFTGFNLVLNDKDEKTTQADTACMFLPFYINQDGGWSGIWHTFKGLQRFRNPTKAIVEYFTQVVPPQYYVAKAALENEQSAISAVDADIRILERTRERLTKSLALAGPQLTPEGFEAEIEQITRQLTGLNARQEALRQDIVGLKDTLASTEHQIALTTDSLARYEQDFSFLAHPSRDELVCPTCGAQHEERFLSVLTFAEDARALADMLIRLQETRTTLMTRIRQSSADREALSQRYSTLQAVLERNRDELKFGDVVKSMGSGVALTAFDQEDRELEQIRSGHLSKRYEFDQEMKGLRTAKRRKRINAVFRGHYRDARTQLNLDARDVSKVQVSSRPDISGSGGPREVLAYYAALWWLSRDQEFESPFSTPLVVDCPAQSGQDIVNLPAMIRFISTGLPLDAQVIMTYEADVPDEFDHRINLIGKQSLLVESEYTENAAVCQWRRKRGSLWRVRMGQG